ncbi:MAG: PQQ-binding-like beta-propeller repeat protein, partial [Verrucomicrobiae bacterium]|nr:PQQ-binding-like beta-propeller repeat protein [Verrucomicrobiae bacterium]
MHVLFNPTLVVHRDVVLFAGGENLDPQRGGKDTMTAFSAKTGETLWTAPHPPSGYASSEDLFVINGLVWCGVTSSPRDSGVFTGRDLRTGKVKAEFPPDDWRHMPHHRCYRSKATCNFILTSRTGIEFVDLSAKHWTANHWVRGSCNYGILPANGLVYAGPHSCACYLLAKLNGMNALAPARSAPREALNAERLQRGPAFGEIRNLKPEIQNPDDWPTYRGNAARGGVSKTKAPVELKRAWQTFLGGRLSAPTVAGGRLFVAAIDAHAVHALDANTGAKIWVKSRFSCKMGEWVQA